MFAFLETAIAKAVLRHMVSGAGVFLVQQGWLNDSQLSEVTGALMSLWAISHSLWDKRHQIVGDIQRIADSATTPPKVPLMLLAAGLAGLMLTGCAGTQVVNATKGTGVDLDLPIGYNGANLLEMKLRIGQFIATTAVQPVSSNRMYAAPLSVASTTGGSVTAPTYGGVGTNSVAATVGGGDAYTVNIGDAQSTFTNKIGAVTSEARQ